MFVFRPNHPGGFERANSTQIEGPLNKGVVNMHLIRRAGQHDYDYRYFYVDVRGHPRLYLENADESADKGNERKGFKLFGVKWS